IRRENKPVAIENVGARGRRRILRGTTACLVALGRDAEHEELAGDDGIDCNERGHGETDAGARLQGAIDLLAVQQCADQAAAPGLCGRRCLLTFRLPAHRGASVGVTEAVRSGSLASIIVRIGSGSFGLMKLGGRSGRFFRLSYCVASMKRSFVWRSA